MPRRPAPTVEDRPNGNGHQNLIAQPGTTCPIEFRLIHINKLSPGAPGKLTDEHKAFLARLVEDGPIPAIDGVVRWWACDLIMRLHEEFGIAVSDDTVYRGLKDLGFSHLSARPRAYKQNAEAMETFKKTSPPAWRRSARNSLPAHL